MFMVCEEWVDVCLIEEFGALSLGKDEVGEDEEAEVGVERDPGRC